MGSGGAGAGNGSPDRPVCPAWHAQIHPGHSWQIPWELGPKKWEPGFLMEIEKAVSLKPFFFKVLAASAAMVAAALSK